MNSPWWCQLSRSVSSWLLVAQASIQLTPKQREAAVEGRGAYRPRSQADLVFILVLLLITCVALGTSLRLRRIHYSARSLNRDGRCQIPGPGSGREQSAVGKHWFLSWGLFTVIEEGLCS